MSTEGLLVYTLDTGLVFDPFDLSEEVTPNQVMAAISQCKYSLALSMSLRLNDEELVTKTVESVPSRDGKRHLLLMTLPGLGGGVYFELITF